MPVRCCWWAYKENINPFISELAGNKLKILIVFNDTQMGGANRSTIELLAELQKHNEIVVVIPGNGDTAECLNEMETRYYVMPFKRTIVAIGTGTQDIFDEVFLDNVSAVYNLLQSIREERIQLVYTSSSTGNIGALLALFLNVPHIWHIREFLHEDFHYEFIDEKFSIELMIKSSRLISVSNCVAEKYKSLYKLESSCIYDGLPLIDSKNKEDNDVKGTNGKIHIMFAGGFYSLKGFMDVLVAVKELQLMGRDMFVFHIIGCNDQYMLWVVRNYSVRNHLIEMIDLLPSQRNLNHYRQFCDISLTCSKAEALGRVTIEAMMAEQVVVGANTCGTLELIGEGEERGYLYQQGDGYDLAQTIIRAHLASLDERCMKLHKAKEFVSEKCDIKRYSNDILNIFHESIRGYRENEKREALLISINERFNRLKNDKEIYKQEQNEDALAKRERIKMNSLYKEKWMKLIYHGFNLEKFLINQNITSIALYGIGYFGMQIWNELSDGSIEIKYVVDKRFEKLSDMLLLGNYKLPLMPVEQVDALLITPIFEGELIKEQYKEIVKCRILLLRDLIDVIEIDLV
jgi:glycosyltransferase involved in cell wall biosynthesis